MLRGQLWATTDINLVNQALTQGFKVIYLGDPISIDPAYKERFVVATAFTPDYQTLSLQVDGNEQGFVQMYTASLNSRAAMEMMAVILACLYRGTSIMFYLPIEATGLNFVQYLLHFIEYNYGIQTQTKSTQFGYNPTFNSKIIELLYLNNLVSAQEFLISTEKIDELSLRKLVDELHPMVKDPRNLDEIIKWFSNYKDQLISSNKPLINGIQYAGETGDYACC